MMRLLRNFGTTARSTKARTDYTYTLGQTRRLLTSPSADEFSDDFESGDLTAWASASDNATVTADAAHTGSFGLNVTSAGAASQVSTGDEAWTQELPFVSLTCDLKVHTALSVANNYIALDLGDGSSIVTLGALFLSPIVTIQGTGDPTIQTLSGIVANTWTTVRMQAYVGGTTWLAAVQVNDGTPVWAIATGQTATYIKDVTLGSKTSEAGYNVDFDRLSIKVGETIQGWLP